MAAITHQSGDPEFIRLFSMQLDEDSKVKGAIDAHRRAFTEGELAHGFMSPGGGTAAQAVEANYMSTNGTRLQSTVQTNSVNTSGVAGLYENSDWNYQHTMHGVMSGGADGQIGSALNPPMASA